jgi:hypothetical protein
VYGHPIIGTRKSTERPQAPMAERQLRSRLQRGSAVSEPSQLFNASKSRRSADACGAFAANAVSPGDRALLLRMQRSRLERARYQDWLDGLPPNPPERANALAVPRRS